MADTILDTDILSEIFKQRDLIVRDRALDYLSQHVRLTFTSVSAGELLFGLYAKDATRQLSMAQAFLQSHDELVPESRDYWLAAKIGGTLHRAGKPVGVADPLIAACAINRGCALATGNVRHYGFVADVGFPITIENWRLQRQT